MNLWDVIFSVVGGLIKQVNKRQEAIDKYVDKYSDLDHNELVRKYRNSTGDAKLAAGILLKKRNAKTVQR